MKKKIAWILAVAIFMVMGATPANALEVDDVGVYVFYTPKDLTNRSAINMSSSAYSNNEVHDLSDSKLFFNFTLSADGSDRTGLFKTNTTNAYVALDAVVSSDWYVKVELLNSSGTSIAEKTLAVYASDERITHVKFTNLTSSKSYNVKITNLSQMKLNIAGNVNETAW